MKKVMLTTGGTGGHIYPALAVADKLELKGVETVFVGSTDRMEKDLVPESGHRFIGIDISVPKGWKNIKKYLKAIKSAYKIIKEENPSAIIGFGNYISVPVIIAGILLRKKIYLQEQNVNIGSANRLFSKIAKMTFLAFDKTYDDIPIKAQSKFKVTGNPLRKEIEGLKYSTEREKLGIKADEKVLLIAPNRLWNKIAEHIHVSFYSFENWIDYLPISEENLLENPLDDKFLQEILLRFISLSKTPIVSNLASYLRLQYFDDSLLLRYVENREQNIICSDLRIINSEEIRNYDKIYFIGCEGEDVLNQYSLPHTLKTTDFLDQKSTIPMRFGGSNYTYITHFHFSS